MGCPSASIRRCGALGNRVGPQLTLDASLGHPPRSQQQAIRLEHDLVARAAPSVMTATLSRAVRPQTRKLEPLGSARRTPARPRVTGPVCAVTEKAQVLVGDRLRCRYGGPATGSKRGPVEVATAGLTGSQARAGPCRRSAVEGDDQLVESSALVMNWALLHVRLVNAGCGGVRQAGAPAPPAARGPIAGPRVAAKPRLSHVKKVLTDRKSVVALTLACAYCTGTAADCDVAGWCASGSRAVLPIPRGWYRCPGARRGCAGAPWSTRSGRRTSHAAVARSVDAGTGSRCPTAEWRVEPGRVSDLRLSGDSAGRASAPATASKKQMNLRWSRSCHSCTHTAEQTTDVDRHAGLLQRLASRRLFQGLSRVDVSASAAPTM